MLHTRKNHFWALQICLFLSAILASCSRKQELAGYIPQNAMAVGKVTTGKLAGKIALDKLGSTEWEDLLDLTERPGRPAPVPGTEAYKWRQLMKNPTQLGVAFFEDMYAFIGEMKGRELGYAGVLMRLDNPAALEEYLQGDVPMFFQGNTQKQGDVQYRVAADGKGAIGWNKNALLLLYAPEGNVDLAAEVGFALNLKKEQSVLNLPEFESFKKDDKDIGVFLNAKQLLSHLPTYNMPSYVLSAGIDYLALGANFNSGYVEVKVVQHLHGSKAKDVEAVFDDISHAEWLERFDMNAALGYANFRFTPSWLKELAMSQFNQEQINTNLQGIGLSEEAFLNIFKGSMMLACTGTGKVKREVITYEMDEEFNMKEVKAIEEVDAPMLLAVAEVDEAGMRDLLQRLVKPAIVAPEGEGYKLTYMGYENEGWKVFLKEGQLIITNEPSLVTSEASYSSDLLSNAQSHPFSAFLNIESVVASFPLLSGIGGKEVAKHFKNVEVLAQRAGESSVEANVRIALQDQGNAFLTLVALLKNAPIAMPEPAPAQ